MKEKPPERLHDEVEFQALRNHLIARFGVPVAQVDLVLGRQANGRTYRQVTLALTHWLRTRLHK